MLKRSLIVAKSTNNIIGDQGKLIWHLPKDLAWFKKITTNKIVIMGRKTFESIGHPLPNRQNWILSSTMQTIPNATVFSNSNKLFAQANAQSQEWIAIGGQSIYQLALNYVNYLYITEIEAIATGDTYFPPIDLSNWTCQNTTYHPKDNKHPVAFTCYEYSLNQENSNAKH